MSPKLRDDSNPFSVCSSSLQRNKSFLLFFFFFVLFFHQQPHEISYMYDPYRPPGSQYHLNQHTVDIVESPFTMVQHIIVHPTLPYATLPYPSYNERRERKFQIMNWVHDGRDTHIAHILLMASRPSGQVHDVKKTRRSLKYYHRERPGGGLLATPPVHQVSSHLPAEVANYTGRSYGTCFSRTFSIIVGW